MQNGEVSQTIRNDANWPELDRQYSNAIKRLNMLSESKNSVSSCWA